MLLTIKCFCHIFHCFWSCYSVNIVFKVLFSSWMSSCHQKKRLALQIWFHFRRKTKQVCVFISFSLKWRHQQREQRSFEMQTDSAFTDSIKILLMAFRINFLNQNIRDYNLGLVNVLLTLESIYDKSFNPNMKTVIKHVWIYWVYFTGTF